MEVDDNMRDSRPKCHALKDSTKFHTTFASSSPKCQITCRDALDLSKSCDDESNRRFYPGRTDDRKHANGSERKRKRTVSQGIRKLSHLPRLNLSPLEGKVTNAELLFASFLVEHNLPIAAADFIGPLVRAAFPDSEIAGAYTSRAAKTRCIIKDALAPHFLSPTVASMISGPFSIGMDGSRASGRSQIHPVTVRLFDVKRHSKVTVEFLSLCSSSAGDANTIFSELSDVFHDHAVPWLNCVSFTMDSTSVSTGTHHSLKSRASPVNPEVYAVGCPRLVLHNAARKGNLQFSKIVGLDVEDLAVDVFYYFDESCKRTEELASYGEFCDLEYRTTLEHVSTRWLRLQTATERILKRYAGLKSYFASVGEGYNPRSQRLIAKFSNPMTEVCLLFFQAVLPSFTDLILLLQREDPCVHLMLSQMQTMLKKLIQKFVEPVQFHNHQDIMDIDCGVVKPARHIFVGFTTQCKLRDLLQSGEIGEAEVNTFHAAVIAFYHTVVDDLKRCLPLSDQVLVHAQFVDFDRRAFVYFDSVEYFTQNFKSALKVEAEFMDQLYDEFTDYQTMRKDEIPASVWKEAEIQVETRDGASTAACHRMDVIWAFLSTLTFPGSSTLRFPLLSSVSRLVLIIPHSNADDERLFSILRKSTKELQPNLDTDSTLSSILTVKVNKNLCTAFSSALLQKAKRVTWEYNNQQSRINSACNAAASTSKTVSATEGSQSNGVRESPSTGTSQRDDQVGFMKGRLSSEHQNVL